MSMTTFNKQNADNGFSEEGTHNTLVAIKDSYNVAIKAIDFVLSIANKGAQVALVSFPDYSPFKHVRTIFRLIGNVTTAIKYKRNVYIRIGNFHFLLDRLEEIERRMEENYQQNVENLIPNKHSLSEYIELFQKIGFDPLRDSPSTVAIQHTGSHGTTHFEQYLQFQCPFQPMIDSVELTRVQKGKKGFLRLSFTGRYIHDVVLDVSRFDFVFPFAKKKDKVKIRTPSMVEDSERLVIEQEMDIKDPKIAETGIVLKLVTQFGECEKIVQSEDMHKTSVSIRQIAENDSVSLVVRRAIQKGIVLKKIKTQSNFNSSEQIIDEIVKLGSVTFGEDLMKKKITEIFRLYVENIDYVFSNEESVRNVKKLCDEI